MDFGWPHVEIRQKMANGQLLFLDWHMHVHVFACVYLYVCIHVHMCTYECVTVRDGQLTTQL